MIFRIPGGICDRSSWGVKHTKNTRAWSKGSSMETKGYLAIQSWISEIKFMASPWIPEKKNTCQRDHPAWVSPLKILKIDTLQNAFLFVKNHHANQAASWFRNPFSVFSIETHQMFKRVFKLKHFAPWKIRDLLVRRLKSPFWKCLHSFFLVIQYVIKVYPLQGGPKNQLGVINVTTPLIGVIFTPVTYLFRPFVGGPCHSIYNYSRGPPCSWRSHWKTDSGIMSLSILRIIGPS